MRSSAGSKRHAFGAVASPMSDDFLVTIAVGRRSAVPVPGRRSAAELGADELTARSSAAVLGVVHPPAHARGCGSGTASRRARRTARRRRRGCGPSSRRIARPPTGTINRGCSNRSSHSRQNEQSSCSRGSGPIAAARRDTPRIAPCDRGAVEHPVEVVLVEPEPAAQRLAGATSPWPELLALDHARRLSEQIRALPRIALDHRTRLDRKPCLGAGTARPVVTLERGERPVRRPPPRHPRERTTTNQFPSNRTSPSPSSSASSDATK